MDFSSLGIADNKLLLWAVAAVAVLVVIYILYRIVVKIKRAVRRLSNRIGRFSNIVEEVYTASKNADKVRKSVV